MWLGWDPERSIAAGPRGVDEWQLVATDEDLRDDERAAVGKPLGERVDEHVLVVGVQHVGQAGAVEPDAAGEPLVRGVGDEVDLGQAVRVGLRSGRPVRRWLAQDETQPRTDRTDHLGRMRRGPADVLGTKVRVRV